MRESQIQPRCSELVSVVIPALDEEALIVRAIAAARRGSAETEVEVIVVDGGSHDRTRSLVPAGVKLVQSARGRGAQMNRGTCEARGRVLVFCHADTVLPVGWRPEVLRILAQPGVSGGSFNPRFVPARGILHLLNRLIYPADWHIIYGDQAMFTHRATLARVGGFREQPLFEDVELARALKRQGRLVRSRLRAETSSRRFLEVGPARHLVRSLWMTLRYAHLGLSPEAAAKRYRSSREEQAEKGPEVRGAGADGL
jgi:uncharacterized protein